MLTNASANGSQECVSTKRKEKEPQFEVMNSEYASKFKKKLILKINLGPLIKRSV